MKNETQEELPESFWRPRVEQALILEAYGLRWDKISNKYGASKVFLLEKAYEYGLRDERPKTIHNAHYAADIQARRDALVLSKFLPNGQCLFDSRRQLLEFVRENGFPKTTISTISRILSRARESGKLPRTEKRDQTAVRRKSSFSSSPGVLSFFKDQPPTQISRHPIKGSVAGMDMSKARISFNELKRTSCRYTPSEEAPFLFCGAPTMLLDGKMLSWCSDCYHNIIKLKEDDHTGTKKALAQ